jgi:cyclomaltodextrin glucanotransferase
VAQRAVHRTRRTGGLLRLGNRLHAGRAEHAGNRNYFGQERIDAASNIARLRRSSPALQRGLQLNERLKGDLAVFYRVYQKGGTNQTALV